MLFRDEQTLWEAKAAVRGLATKFPGMSKEAWCDRKKTRDHLMPSRVLTALTAAVGSWRKDWRSR